MSIKSRVQRLLTAAKPWISRKRQMQRLEAERLAFRQRCIAAGVRPPDDRGNLAPGEWDKYCQFYDLDYDRDSHDMPCDSWRFKTRPFGMAKIWYWYSEFQRGAMTREEYHRLVLDFAARLEAEGSSSSGG